jgi:hypothetical protein
MAGDTWEQAMRIEMKARQCLVYTLLGNCLYEAAKADPKSVPEPVFRVVDDLMKKCYPEAWIYRDIIRDVEGVRGKQPLRPKVVH